jgi:hypothetical protein
VRIAKHAGAESRIRLITSAATIPMAQDRLKSLTEIFLIMSRISKKPDFPHNPAFSRLFPRFERKFFSRAAVRGRHRRKMTNF